MLAIQKIRQSVGNGCHSIIEAGNKIVTKTDGTEKASKFVISVIETMQQAPFISGVVLAPLVILRGRLKAFTEIVSALAFLNRGKEWFTPDDSLEGTAEQGKRFWQSNKNTKVKIWHTNITIMPKIWNRACLTVSAAIDTAKFLDSMEFIRLGKIASFAIGRVPVLGLVKDTAVMGASVFSFWENCQKLENSSANYSKVKKKHRAWQAVSDLNKPSKAVSVKARLSETKRKDAAINACKAYAAKKYSAEIQQRQDRFGAADAKVIKWTKYKKAIEEGRFSDFCNAKKESLKAKLVAAITKKEQVLHIAELELKQLKLAGETTPPQLEEKVKTITKLKEEIAVLKKKLHNLTAMSEKDIALWKEEKLKVREDNISTNRNKSWITIANEVVKLVLIGSAITSMALGVTTLFTVGSFVVSASLAITLMGLLANSIGITKFLYDEFHKKDKPEPGLPGAAAAPAA